MSTAMRLQLMNASGPCSTSCSQLPSFERTQRRVVSSSLGRKQTSSHVCAVAAAEWPNAPPLSSVKLNKLGSSDIMVSEVGLGTMTFGEQNTEAEAHWQLGFAKDCGINFLDTAEIYPVAPRRETANRTSTYIGRWLATQPRDRWVVASKVTGRSDGLDWVPAGRTDPPGSRSNPVVSAAAITAAVDGELRRLQTDYIDVMQIHWPDRYVPLFGKRQYDLAAAQAAPVAHSFEEQAQALGALIRQGKIRAWGLSNETAWGVMQQCMAADACGVPRPITIQNSYSLLHRTFEADLAEVCAPHNLDLGLLPWSATAGGALSGKYLGTMPEDPSWRLTKWPERYARFRTPQVMAAVAKYADLAKEAGLTPIQLAYAWCRSCWFIPSTLIGATTPAQLAENMHAFTAAGVLGQDVLQAIQAIHLEHPNPSLSD